MPVIPFPTPSTPRFAFPELVRFARTRALSVRFKGRPADAVRWAMQASPIEVEVALTADDVLTLAGIRRMIVEARKAGDTERAMELQAVAARLFAAIKATGRRNHIQGWRY